MTTTPTADTKTAAPLVRLTDAGKNYGNIIALGASPWTSARPR